MMQNLFNQTYQNLPVLVTGHTGFKGSWLVQWLLEMGADVIGYSLPEMPTSPSNFELCHLAQQMTDMRDDIQDVAALQTAVDTYKPQIIFHMAAQPVVIHGYQHPKNTFDINVGGTVNMLEVVRRSQSVRALVNITTDKVYENHEWIWGYRENDALGGHDPYSASKAMAELAIAAYRDSYFPPEKYAEHGVAVASVRAGNVIGGGDFAAYRLVPDSLKALLDEHPIGVRNPMSVRPWQHVLEPLSGYLALGAELLADGAAFSQAWNFGPLERQGVPVGQMADRLVELWGSGSWEHLQPGIAAPETGYLRLSWEKAAAYLNWQPVYTLDEALAEIVAWFKAYERDEDMAAVGRAHIQAYVKKAKTLGLKWTEM
ncbi:MAG: CDP-glucose 4,6-dehydratase [Chloroflexi bacterium]|nr:CDP-glucose 4,6-dehydratase [Chloroflexota bacterium]